VIAIQQTSICSDHRAFLPGRRPPSDDALRPFVERELKTQYERQWFEQLKASLPPPQLGFSGNENNPNWDVASVLAVLWGHWNTVFRKTLGQAERALVSELRDVRNRWAHQRPFSTDDAYRALDSSARLLSAISAPQGLRPRRQQPIAVLRTVAYKLGCVMAGESPAIFGDALRRLSSAATYLYHDAARYWYSTQPTVTKIAEDRAEQLKADPDKMVQELDRRVRSDVRWVAGVGPNLSSSRTLFARRGRVQRLAGGDHSTTGELIPPLANSPGGCHEIRRARSRGRLAVCRVDAALCAGCRRTQSAQPTGIALGAREPLIR